MDKLEYIVNLDLEPNKRWTFLNEFRDEIDELLEYYLSDFEEADFIFDSIGEYKKNVISSEYLSEIDYISSISKFSSDEVLIANLYYDILKFYFGCTAFAVRNDETIFHSRNLDWHTDNNLLSKHSRIFDFQRNGKTIYKTVGWLGFIGALSGIKPAKFSLTLNAVLSNDEPEIATPVSFLLRDILLSANSYHEAKEILEKTTIASDCLVLLSGINENEMVVIERTTKRFATRKANGNFITVTNDYKQLENSSSNGENILQATSCGRYDRTAELLDNRIPKNKNECLQILKDKKVMMRITVQQMVFNNITGDIELIKTGDNKKYT